MPTVRFQDFLHKTRPEDIPQDIHAFSKRCILDLVGVMVAGSETRLTDLISHHAVEHFAAGSKSASILFDGRNVSPAGAALANGMMIDSIDAHDGFRPAKGHIGCHVLPTLFSIFEAEGKTSGEEFLTCIAIGYEIGARCALALHGSVPDYHTSGAWGAVTSAALCSRILAVDETTTRHAIGIGEYHGPRSQMMRCIDHPTMLKDGSGWGAMAGVSASYLAASGFTGAPAITVEAEEVSHHWGDLGSRWTILEQYFKPYPVCRWAQPATEASLTLTKQHGFTHEQIAEIVVHTFHEASRLATVHPASTEEAQYSLPFPVGAALVFGKVGPNEVSGDALTDERVLRLAENTVLKEFQPYNDAFPAERFAHVEITLKDGNTFESECHPARGDYENPLSDSEIEEKYYGLASPVIGKARAETILKTVENLGPDTGFDALLAVLKPPA
ncbi:MAG: MmgE/PrpD family protein [Pseudomonadota bacterium]